MKLHIFLYGNQLRQSRKTIGIHAVGDMLDGSIRN